MFFTLFILALIAVGVYYYLFKEPSSPTDDASPSTSTHIPTEVPKTSAKSPRDKVAKSFESAEWLNTIVALSWPYVGKITEVQLKNTVEPIINSSLPKPFSGFQFLKCHLGKDPLKIDRVTVHTRYEDSIALDLDVHFQGSPDIKMKCSPLGSFGVSEFRWEGRLSVLLRPLITTVPLVGAVTAAFVSPPKQEIEFTGVANIADFGPVERLVDKIIRDTINQLFVYPNKFLFKMSDAIDFFKVYYQPACAWKVTVVGGLGFTKEKKFAGIKSTPDIRLSVKFGLEKLECPKVSNSLEPMWNLSRLFVVHDLEQPLLIKAYDSDPVGDDLLGVGTVPAYELLEKKRLDLKLTEKIDQKMAANAFIKVQGERYDFSPDVRGACVVSVLIDRASRLPKGTKSSCVKVNVGGQERQTATVLEPAQVTPGVDPQNPVWSQSYDIVCRDIVSANTTLAVVADRREIAKLTFNAADVSSSGGEKAGWFDLGNGIKIRAKCFIRGLSPAK